MATKYNLDINTLSESDVSFLIKEASEEVARYVELHEYYKGEHPILDRTATDSAKPNNKLVNNFPGYITDVNVGYFMGKPVTYSTVEEEDEMKDAIQDILDYNDEQVHNASLATTSSIMGTAFELLYIDELANVRFGEVSPCNLILVYNDKISPEPLFAIRYGIDDVAITTTGSDGMVVASKKSVVWAELYTDKEIIEYGGELGKGFTESDRRPHQFGSVPVVEYLNNDDRMSDFEKVLTLVDAYDLAQSDSANDFDYFADAYLMIKNMSGTNSDDIAAMKSKRVILVDGDGDASWLTKTIQDTASQNFKNRLQTDIHRFSMTPNLTDEAFAGNLSGVGLEFKLWGLEQVAARKERKFKKGLQRRLELLCNFLNVKNGTEYDWRNLEISFTRNIPANVPDIVDMVSKLNGIISNEKLLGLLPFIEDPQREMDRIKKEQEDTVDLDSINDEEPPADAEINEEGEVTNVGSEEGSPKTEPTDGSDDGSDGEGSTPRV